MALMGRKPSKHNLSFLKHELLSIADLTEENAAIDCRGI
jgi:hypothetical protein